MKSTIKDIFPKICEAHPDVKPDTLKNLIDLYFNLLVEEINNPSKPEIAVPWATLKISQRQIAKRRCYVSLLLQNPEIKDRDKLEEEFEFLQKLYQVALTRPKYKSEDRKNKVEPIIEKWKQRYKKLKDESTDNTSEH